MKPAATVAALTAKSVTLLTQLGETSLRFYAILMGFYERYTSSIIMTRIHMSWIPHSKECCRKIPTANSIHLIEQSENERTDVARGTNIDTDTVSGMSMSDSHRSENIRK